VKDATEAVIGVNGPRREALDHKEGHNREISIALQQIQAI